MAESWRRHSRIDKQNWRIVRLYGFYYTISKINEESNEYIRVNGSVQTGSCAVTGAGNLLRTHGVKNVIHTVGPAWNEVSN